MVIARRIWNIFFGGWFQLRSGKTEFQGERIMGHQLILTARDEFYQIQLKLTADQADDLQAWLSKTRSALNTTGRNKVIHLPISNRKK